MHGPALTYLHAIAEVNLRMFGDPCACAPPSALVGLCGIRAESPISTTNPIDTRKCIQISGEAYSTCGIAKYEFSRCYSRYRSVSVLPEWDKQQAAAFWEPFMTQPER